MKTFFTVLSSIGFVLCCSYQLCAQVPWLEPDQDASTSSNPGEFTLVGSELYFVANANGDTELYHVPCAPEPDPDPSDNKIDVNTSSSSFASNLVNWDGMLFFVAYRPAEGFQIYTLSGGNLISPATTFPPFNSYSQLRPVNSMDMYFVSNGNLYQLTRNSPSDFTQAEVLNTTGGSLSSISGMTAYNNTVLFSARNAGGNSVLWSVSDTGAPEADQLVDDLGGEIFDPTKLTIVGTDIYFIASTSSNGPTELYRYDGTNSPSRVLGITTPSLLEEVNSRLYLKDVNDDLFEVNNGVATMLSISGSTRLNCGTTTNNMPGTAIAIRSVNNIPFIVTSDGVYQYIDGNGIQLIQDGFDLIDNNMEASGNMFYFSARILPADPLQLWWTDGTKCPVLVDQDINIESPSGFISVPGTNAVFFASDSDYGREAFKAAAPNGVLAVEMFYFEAQVLDETEVRLDWATLSEAQNEGFEIERSATAKDWETLDFVAGYGTTLEEQHYKYVDSKPLQGSSYYRLKQIDEDGQYTYSSIVQIYLGKNKTELHTWPNPAQNYLNYTLTGIEKEEVSITLYAPTGKIHYQTNSLEETTEQIDLTELARGIYYLKVQTPTEEFIQRIVRMD